MKRYLHLCLLFCISVIAFGQTNADNNPYNTISDLPFLNNERIISINRSNHKDFRKINKKYIKIMTNIVIAKNVEDKHKAVSKAKDYFENLVNDNINEFYGENDKASKYLYQIAHYQLGHYYAFGIFDPYFDGEVPSNLDRTKLSTHSTNEFLANRHFDKISESYTTSMAKGLIHLIPNTWCFDIAKGLAPISGDPDFVEIVQYLDSIHCYYNPENVFNCQSGYCDYCETKSILPYDVVGLLYAIKKLPTNSPTRKHLLLDLNSDEIASLALSYEKQNKPREALYYAALSAVRGNANGYLKFVDIWSKNLLTHYKTKHPEYYKLGTAHEIAYIQLWSINCSLNECNIPNFKQLSESLNAYYSELGDKLYNDYVAEEKAKKKARRRETWRQLGLAFAGALQQTSAQISNYYSQPNYSNMGNINSLLDPRLAAIQVNAMYYAQYQEFCKYNKKTDGSNYTYGEWSALQGQSYQNVNGSNSQTSTDYQTRKRDILNTTVGENCQSCKGSGKCAACNGTKVANSFGNTYTCNVCDENGKCPVCDGTGKTSWNR